MWLWNNMVVGRAYIYDDLPVIPLDRYQYTYFDNSPAQLANSLTSLARFLTPVAHIQASEYLQGSSTTCGALSNSGYDFRTLREAEDWDGSDC